MLRAPRFSSGQTLIEMLIMLSIVTLLSSTLILFNKQAQGEKELYEEARKLVVDLRAAQDLAFSMQTVGGETPCGYGIELLPDTSGYEVFVAMPQPPRTCGDVQAGFYTKIALTGSAMVPQPINYFSNLTLYSYTASPIIFVPPYPRTLFFPQSDAASFRFYSKKSGQGSQVEIQLNRAGQITVQEPVTP